MIEFYHNLFILQKNENMRLKEELQRYKDLVAMSDTTSSINGNNNINNHIMEKNIQNNDKSKIAELEATIRKLKAKIMERELIDERLDRERQQRAQQLAIVRKLKPIQSTSNEIYEKSDALTPPSEGSVGSIIDIVNKNNQININNSNLLQNNVNNKENLKSSLQPQINTQIQRLPRFDRSIKPIYQSAEEQNNSLSTTSLNTFIPKEINIDDIYDSCRMRNFSPIRAKVVSIRYFL